MCYLRDLTASSSDGRSGIQQLLRLPRCWARLYDRLWMSFGHAQSALNGVLVPFMGFATLKPRISCDWTGIPTALRPLPPRSPQDTKRLFEGEALMRRMYKYGLLEEQQNKLDYVLALTPTDFLERRLQTLVFKLGLAKSIHHARVLIRQRHIRCGAARRSGSHTPRDSWLVHTLVPQGSASVTGYL